MNTISSKNMTFIIIGLMMVFSIMNAPLAHAETRFGQKLCGAPDYYCIKVKRGDSWEKLWPKEDERDIVKRVNRMNVRIGPGMVLAVPKQLPNLTIYDVSPFPRYIDPPGEKTIYVSQKYLAWGAYDAKGELAWWGPASPGKNYCPDIDSGCKTPGGMFNIERKQGIDCISTEFPRHSDGTKGGAPMPYCMHFLKGFALHGSYVVPGVRDSHGCIRLFIEDAKWLNEQFIDLPKGGMRGTKVVVEATGGGDNNNGDDDNDDNNDDNNDDGYSNNGDQNQ